MGISEDDKDFFTIKEENYDVVFSGKDKVLRMGAYSKYRIGNYINPKITITNDRIDNKSSLLGVSKSQDLKYWLNTGDQVKIIENIRRVKRTLNNPFEYEVDLVEIVKKDGKRSEDTNNYYCWTIYKGTKKVKHHTEKFKNISGYKIDLIKEKRTREIVERESELYTISIGDTLSKIAGTYGMTWQDLYEYKGGTSKTNRERLKSKNPNIIFPGEIIVVPKKLIHFFLTPSSNGSRNKILEFYGINGGNTFNEGIKIEINHSQDNKVKAICSGKLFIKKLEGSFELKLVPDIEINLPEFEKISSFTYKGVKSIDNHLINRTFILLSEEIKECFKKEEGREITKDDFFKSILEGKREYLNHLKINKEIWVSDDDMSKFYVIGLPENELIFKIETTKINRVFEHNNKVVKYNKLDPISFWYKILKCNEFNISKEERILTEETLLKDNYKRIILELRDEYNCPMTSGTHYKKLHLLKLRIQRIYSIHPEYYTGLNSNRGVLILNTQFMIEANIAGRKDNGELMSSLSERFLFQNSMDNKNYSKQMNLSIKSPNHVIIYTIQPADWFAEQDVKVDHITKDFPIEAISGAKLLNRYTSGNKAVALVDGFEYFTALNNSFKLIDATNRSHSIHIAGWAFYNDLVIINNYRNIRGTNYKDGYGNAFKNLIKQNALKLFKTIIVRYKDRFTIQFYDPDVIAGFKNEDTEADELQKRLNKLGLKNRYLRDDKVSNKGAIHMKVIVFKRDNHYTGFCGGIDLWPNRLTDRTHEFANSETWAEHDIGIKIEGSAANELNLVLYQRWADNKREDLHYNDPYQYSERVSFPKDGKMLIQVARTIPKDAQMAFSSSVYSFAENGDNTIWNTINKALYNAKVYVYIEDQYFQNSALVNTLIDILPNIEFLIIIIPFSNLNEEWRDKTPKYQINTIKFKHPDDFKRKVKFCFLHNGKNEIYVHSKLIIIDDIFVSCGSANLDANGLAVGYNNETKRVEKLETASQECNIMILDEHIRKDGIREFAHNLRLKLWKEHLVLPESYNLIKNPIEGFLAYWNSDYLEKTRKNESHIRFFSKQDLKMNEDDFCPCRSGKKYDKCHGR